MNKISAANQYLRPQNRPQFTSANSDIKKDGKKPIINMNLNKDLTLGFGFISLLWGGLMGNIEYDSLKKTNIEHYKNLRIAGTAISGFFASLGACFLVKMAGDKIKKLKTTD